MSEYAELETKLEFTIKDIALFREAFTHPSFAAEHNDIPSDNQRLELLGDAVVQIILTTYLFQRYPELHEGNLTKIRSAMVRQDSLALLARDISLGHYLRVGHGEIEVNGNNRESTLSDAFEAFFGAIYLDLGLDDARRILMKLIMIRYPEPSDLLENLNPKGELQEIAQKYGVKTPVYRILTISGPAHNPVFESEVVLPVLSQEIRGTGTGTNRKNAEQDAARNALRQVRELIQKQVEITPVRKSGDATNSPEKGQHDETAES